MSDAVVLSDEVVVQSFEGAWQRFHGLGPYARVAQCVCQFLERGNFAGRVDLPPDEWHRLELELVAAQCPTFRLAGEPDTPDYRIELVISGATVRVYVNRVTRWNNIDVHTYRILEGYWAGKP